jgi:hypothetical protein
MARHVVLGAQGSTKARGHYQGQLFAGKGPTSVQTAHDDGRERGRKKSVAWEPLRVVVVRGAARSGETPAPRDGDRPTGGVARTWCTAVPRQTKNRAPGNTHGVRDVVLHIHLAG